MNLTTVLLIGLALIPIAVGIVALEVLAGEPLRSRIVVIHDSATVRRPSVDQTELALNRTSDLQQSRDATTAKTIPGHVSPGNQCNERG